MRDLYRWCKYWNLADRMRLKHESHLIEKANNISFSHLYRHLLTAITSTPILKLGTKKPRGMYKKISQRKFCIIGKSRILSVVMHNKCIWGRYTWGPGSRWWSRIRKNSKSLMRSWIFYFFIFTFPCNQWIIDMSNLKCKKVVAVNHFLRTELDWLLNRRGGDLIYEMLWFYIAMLCFFEMFQLGSTST